MAKPIERTPGRLAIAHVAAPAHYGGLESMLALLANELALRGHAVHVIALLDREPVPHPFEQRLADGAVALHPVRLSARAYFEERRVLRQALAELRPDAVHTHGYRADVQAGAVARRLGVRVVSTAHGFTGGDFKNRLYEWLQRRALRRADAVVAVSQPLCERLRATGVARERLHLLPNAWGGRVGALPRDRARSELGLAPESFAVGWVGRLSFEKGADVLLAALAARPDPRVVACVIGDGPERAALADQASALGVSDRVNWCGARSEAGRLFAAFDAFALSSRTEGTPMVLFEAMDAGVPIVATAVGGVPDVIGPDTAWLVASEDPDAFAHGLAELRANPAEAARRAAAARADLAQRYGLAPWLDAYERIYRGDPT